MPLRTPFAALASCMLLALACLAAETPPPAPEAGGPKVPARVREAFKDLPKEAQPVEWRAARNGALYALLPNGAELIVKEKRNAPVVAVQGWVRTGANHEREFMGAGLSHFCEHLLFKGTVKRPTGQLDQEIRGGGGDNNAYTSSERTVYHVTTETSGWKNSFDCIADMIMNSTFPEEEVKKEHGVVAKEIERSADNPDSQLWDAFSRLVFQVHPYRVPVLGYPERFAAVTREEVFAYYKRRYAPQMTAFLVVGDVDAAEALPLMAKTVAGWARTDVDEVPLPQEPAQVAPREAVVRHPLCQAPRMYMGYASVALRDPDLYALDVLASVLGDGRTSRLYKRVKDELQLAEDISAWNWTPADKGIFGITFTAEEAKLPAARKAVLDEVEKTIALPPSDEELTRAKRKVQAQHIFSQTNAEGVAEALGGDWLTAGDLDFSETYVDGIGKVTAEQVVKAAQKYLRPERLNVAIMLPGGEDAKADVEHPAGGDDAEKTKRPEQLNEAAEAWKKAEAEIRPKVAELKASDVPGGKVVEIKLNSGLRVVVREDHALPAVHVALSMLGGQRWEPDNLPGAANLFAEMLDHGTETRSKLQIAAQAEDLGASVSTFGGRNTCGINLRCLSGDLPAVFGLGADCLLHANFPGEELKKTKQEVLLQIDQEDEELFTIAGKQFRPRMYGKHPYGRPVLGTRASVEKLESPELVALHRAWLRPENLAIAFAGDVTVSQAFELVQKHFGEFKPAIDFTPPAHALEALAPEQRSETRQPGIQGAILLFGYRGVSFKNADRETLDLAGALLSGLGGRLSVVVREKLGAAYSVGAYNDSQLDGGAFVFYVQTDEASLPKLEEVFREEAKKLRDQPVDEKELASIKGYLSGQEAIALQDPGDVAQRLALSQLYEEGAASVFTRREKYAKITAAQVQEAAKKYFDEKAWVLTVVKPAPEAPKAGEAPENEKQP
ncbi:MAG: insulinase family protein [Planctomycetota bacterium]|nr:insulinase family protein [Planctomycetota bacterium]